MNLIDYGLIPTMLPKNVDGIPARIITTHKDRYEIVCEYGTSFARLKASIFYNNGGESFPTTGDFVLINYLPEGDSQITKTLERKSVFIRNSIQRMKVGHTNSVNLQYVAANFDYVFIIASLNFDFNIRRIERYLTLAWQSGAVPVVVLTKADLVNDFSEQVYDVKKIAVNVGVYVVSAKTRYGISELSDYLKPCKTIVFLGSSGVGKSSLVNALAGEKIMDVNEIRENDSKGRHTTTHRQLIMMDSGVMIIDTPGMRELGMWDVSTGLGEVFNDVEQYFGKCKFSNCKHNFEPGCAVKTAIESGELPPERWKSYLQLKREAKFSDNKVSLRCVKQQRHKELAKYNKTKKIKLIKGDN